MLKLVRKYQLLLVLRRENYDVWVLRERNLKLHKLIHSLTHSEGYYVKYVLVLHLRPTDVYLLIFNYHIASWVTR